ncbi:AAA family ATPase, partial [Salmonella enterica subsp. enterica]|nr:AAA family ATPase [Salmonella enterica subsp. enterica]
MGNPETSAQLQAVLPLPLHPGLRTGTILGDTQIHHDLLHPVTACLCAVHDDLPYPPGRYAGQTRHVDKTTALRALHRAWTAAHGRDSVIGLAPSAAAAEVLGDSLGVRAE